MTSSIRNLLKRFLAAHAVVEDESRQWQNERDPEQILGHVIGVTIIGCVVLSGLEYYGSSGDYRWLGTVLSWFGVDGKTIINDLFRTGPRSELFRLSYWSFSTFVGYFVIPAIYIKFFLRHRIRDYGLYLKGIGDHAWVYAGMYFVILPLVIAMAFTESFQSTYPFYGNAGMSMFDFLAWQAIYALQFFCLEFFFRGFLIHGLRGRFGFYAIFLSMIPYCMIHFGKPFPETLGAIIAGIALGVLSLMTRSVLLGFAIHVSVAITMDALSVAIKHAKAFGEFFIR